MKDGRKHELRLLREVDVRTNTSSARLRREVSSVRRISTAWSASSQIGTLKASEGQRSIVCTVGRDVVICTNHRVACDHTEALAKSTVSR